MTLQVGQVFSMEYVIPPGKSVPDLYPESKIFSDMPAVFATGYLVGLMEWCCLEHLIPNLGPGQISLGLGVDIIHVAPCTEGAEVEVNCKCVAVKERRVAWDVEVYCREVLLGKGRHVRGIVPRADFIENVNSIARGLGAHSIK